MILRSNGSKIFEHSIKQRSLLCDGIYCNKVKFPLCIFQYLNTFNTNMLENHLSIKLMFSEKISTYMERLELEIRCNKIVIIYF